jgi:hypothetical protein
MDQAVAKATPTHRAAATMIGERVKAGKRYATTPTAPTRHNKAKGARLATRRSCLKRLVGLVRITAFP